MNFLKIRSRRSPSRRRFLRRLAAVLAPTSAAVPAARSNPITLARAMLPFIATRSTARATAAGVARGLGLRTAAHTAAKAIGPARVVAGGMVAARTGGGRYGRLLSVGQSAWLVYDIANAMPGLKHAFEAGGPPPETVPLGQQQRLVQVAVQVENTTAEPLSAVLEFVLFDARLLADASGQAQGQFAHIVLGAAEVQPGHARTLAADLDLTGLVGRYVAGPAAVFLGTQTAVPGIRFVPPGVVLDLKA